MILVTGATGTTGSEVVRQLARQGIKLRALVRNRQKAGTIEQGGVEIVSGDLGRPATLDEALRGVTRVFLVSSADPRQAELQGNLVKAAKRANVEHIVKLSALGASLHSPISLARLHARTEREIEESGIAWTHLRPHYFMQNLPLWLGPTVAAEGKIYAPLGDAGISMIDVRDVAEVAVACLTQGGHAGRAYDLTGPEAVSYQDLAYVLSKILDRPVTYLNIPLADARKSMLGSGMPEWLAEALTGLFSFFATGQAAFVSPAVEQITGRPGRSIEKFLWEYADLFMPRSRISAEWGPAEASSARIDT